MKKQLLTLFAVLLAIAPAMSQSYDFSVAAPTGQTLYYKINGSNVTVTGHENNISGNLIIPASVSYNNNTYIVTSIKANAFSNCSGLTSVVVPNTVSSIENSAFENCSGLASFTMGNGKAGERGGLFSSSSGTQVRFAQGNLQFQASTGTWRLADHQYDIIGADNTNISSTYSGWIDLFGWGTSGWNSGANAYQPWATNSDYTDYYPGGSYSNSLTGTYARADWGVYNAISNGGDAPGLWRVPTKDEWVYITKSRRGSTVNGVANARFAKVRVNGINGLLLFPDSYTHPNCVTQPTNINVGGADYGANSYTTEDIDAMESAGAVFLPAAGFRTGGGETSVSNVGTHGQYWSSTHDNFARACCLSFITDGSSELEPFYCIQRQRGRPVRLVRAPSGQQTTLGSRVFSGANNLTQANFSGTLIEWLNIDFNDAQSNPMAKSYKLAIGGEVITNLVIPTGVTEVKKYAFYNDTVVTSLTLSSCITTVADSAFAGMTNLVNLTLDGFSELPTYSTKAFDGIDKSAVTVVVPCSLLDIAVNTNWGGFSHFRGEGTPIMTLQQTNGGTIEITDANTCTSNDITLTAFPNTGFIFVQWSDGSTINPYTLTLAHDSTMSAVFAPNNQQHTITVVVNNDAYGTVSGGGTYDDGATAILTASPNCGCWFTHWEDQYGNVLGAGTLTITVNSDATYTAVFETVPTTGIQLTCNTGQTLVYSINCDSNTATLTGYVGTPIGALEIPSSISYYGRSYDVTSIDTLTFYSCKRITSVTIPNSITTICSQAFLYCNGLTSLYIPASVTSIGNYAFVGCGHLETIIVSDSNTVFDSRNNCNALIHTGSNSLLQGCCNTVIPDDVVTLSYGAFEYSTLRSIVIPNSVVSIERYAFSGCDNLTSMVVANGNPVFDSRDNCNAIIQTSTNTLVSGCPNTVIPNTVTTIGESAFAFCKAMTTVTIPSSITYIAAEGFRECRNLTSITCLATTPPTLNPESFYQSPMNIPVYVPCGTGNSYRNAEYWNAFTNIQEDCSTPGADEYDIRTCTGQTLRFKIDDATHTATVIGYVGQCNGGLTIPAWFSVDGVRYTVTAIGPRAFENCRTLESVILPRSITLVDTEAFKNCSALINVDMK